MLQLDSQAPGARYNRDAVEAMFKEVGIPENAWGNDLLCKRAVVFSNLIKQKEWEDIQYLFPSFLEVYKEFEKSNCLIKQISREDFIKAAFFIGDLAKIVGYGRDSNTRQIENLKKAMQDAVRVGVLYVLFSRSMDGLNSLVSGLRYVIFESPDSKDWARMRTEAPAALNSRLALLFDTMDADTPQKKFKHTLLRPEI